MYARVHEALLNEDAIGADMIARECILFAEARGASAGFINTLHMILGKAFLDADAFESATRHLSETARRGGRYVYPLALCLARSGDIDGGFTLLLDEIDRMPSLMSNLLPAVLMLMAQVQPSETIYERIDLLMERIERGERLTIGGRLEASDEDHWISLGTKDVHSRIIRSLVVRFPESTEFFDPDAIQFFTPEELELFEYAQGVSGQKITSIPGGFFVEWISPVEVAAIKLDKSFSGPLQIMFDMLTVEELVELDQRPSPVTSPELITALADYWIVRGKPERAIPLYESSLARGDLDDTRAFVFQNNLAMLYSQVLGQHDKALEVVDNALAMPGKRENVTLLDTKGLIFLNAGNPTEAIPVLERAVELSCQLPIYCMHLAYALHLDGRGVSASRYFNSARDLLLPHVPTMTKENRAMFDTLQQQYPPIGGSLQ